MTRFSGNIIIITETTIFVRLENLLVENPLWTYGLWKINKMLTFMPFHSVHPPFPQGCGGGGGLDLQTSFQKEGAWQDLNL